MIRFHYFPSNAYIRWYEDFWGASYAGLAAYNPGIPATENFHGFPHVVGKQVRATQTYTLSI